MNRRTTSSRILVADVMTGPAPIVPGHLTMGAARKIAALKSVRWLLVEDEGILIGFVDPRTLAVSRDDDLVSARMTTLGLAVSATASAARAHALLCQRRLAWSPVVAGMFVVGAVSRVALERTLDVRSEVAPGASAAAA
jgi:CBS domain-containing protein